LVPTVTLNLMIWSRPCKGTCKLPLPRSPMLRPVSPKLFFTFAALCCATKAPVDYYVAAVFAASRATCAPITRRPVLADGDRAKKQSASTSWPIRNCKTCPPEQPRLPSLDWAARRRCGGLKTKPSRRSRAATTDASHGRSRSAIAALGDCARAQDDFKPR